MLTYRHQPEARIRARAHRATATSLAIALVTACFAALPAQPAHAQVAGTSLNEVVLSWMRGHYASPVLCEFERGPVRGIRRISIEPGPMHSRPPTGRIRFTDLAAGEASRCTDDLGNIQSNVVGSILVRMPGGYTPTDTVQRDFRNALRRTRGFDLLVAEGILRIEQLDGAKGETEDVDFSGGTASLHLVAPGTDDALLLKEFDSARKAVLKLRTKTGRELTFRVFFADPPERATGRNAS